MSDSPIPLWRKLGVGDNINPGDVFVNAGAIVDIYNPTISAAHSFVPDNDPYRKDPTAYTSVDHYRPINRAAELPAVNSAGGLTATVKSAESFREACGAGPLPDSGARKEYATGAVRDASEGKGHFHSIPPSALRRIAKRFEDGAKKYAKNNWMKGIALSHYQDSLTRHTLAWAEGDKSEDHIGAILWNASAMDWTEQEIATGRLPAELDDLPYRKR